MEKRRQKRDKRKILLEIQFGIQGYRKDKIKKKYKTGETV